MSQQEDNVPSKTDPAQAPLFDLPAPEPPAAEARKPEGAQAVVAAYVESWRRHNAEGEPLKSYKGRIARDAKAMLAKGEATEAELILAASEMGSGVYSNLGVQLNMVRRRRSGTTTGHSMPLAYGDPAWDRVREQLEALHADDQPDPEVDGYLARYAGTGVA